jgi:hypothetical protein
MEPETQLERSLRVVSSQGPPPPVARWSPDPPSLGLDLHFPKLWSCLPPPTSTLFVVVPAAVGSNRTAFGAGCR